MLSLFGRQHSGSQLALPSVEHSVQRMTHRPGLIPETSCRRWFCHALQCATDDTCPDVLLKVSTRKLAGHGLLQGWWPEALLDGTELLPPVEIYPVDGFEHHGLPTGRALLLCLHSCSDAWITEDMPAQS